MMKINSRPLQQYLRVADGSLLAPAVGSDTILRRHQLSSGADCKTIHDEVLTTVSDFSGNSAKVQRISASIKNLAPDDAAVVAGLFRKENPETKSSPSEILDQTPVLVGTAVYRIGSADLRLSLLT